MPRTRVLLVQTGDAVVDSLTARRLRDRGAEVVWLPPAEAAAIFMAATQEAVDVIYCAAAQFEAVTQAAAATDANVRVCTLSTEGDASDEF